MIVSVARLALMPDGENQDDVVGGQPTVLCDVPVPAARQDQLATAVFCEATEQRVLGEQSDCRMYSSRAVLAPASDRARR